MFNKLQSGFGGYSVNCFEINFGNPFQDIIHRFLDAEIRIIQLHINFDARIGERRANQKMSLVQVAFYDLAVSATLGEESEAFVNGHDMDRSAYNPNPTACLQISLRDAGATQSFV